MIPWPTFCVLIFRTSFFLWFTKHRLASLLDLHPVWPHCHDPLCSFKCLASIRTGFIPRAGLTMGICDLCTLTSAGLFHISFVTCHLLTCQAALILGSLLFWLYTGWLYWAWSGPGYCLHLKTKHDTGGMIWSVDLWIILLSNLTFVIN